MLTGLNPYVVALHLLRPPKDSASLGAVLYQPPSLERLQTRDLGGRQRAALGKHVDHLATNHASATCRGAQSRHQLDPSRGVGMGVLIGQKLESPRQQRVARQHDPSRFLRGEPRLAPLRQFGRDRRRRRALVYGGAVSRGRQREGTGAIPQRGAVVEAEGRLLGRRFGHQRPGPREHAVGAGNVPDRCQRRAQLRGGDRLAPSGGRERRIRSEPASPIQDLW